MKPGLLCLGACAWLVCASVGADPLATATERLAARHGGLVAFGVPVDDGALVQGDAASARCAREPASCDVADAAYDLAAARRELAEAHALCREFGIRPSVPPRARALVLAETLARPELARLEAARARTPREPTLERILEVWVHTRVAAATARAEVDARAAIPSADAALGIARTIGAAAAEHAATDDDAYRTRVRGGAERASTRRQAAAQLSAGLEARIHAIQTPDRPTFEASLAAARALPDDDARLAALLAIADALDAASRHAP